MPEAVIPSAELQRARRDTEAMFGWSIIRLLLDSDLDLKALAKEVGMRRSVVQDKLLHPSKLSIRDVGRLYFAFDVRPEFRFIPKEDMRLVEKAPSEPRWLSRRPTTSFIALQRGALA